MAEPPHSFGRYLLRERVGTGGMAEVFRASMPGFGGFDKTVAIKRMFRQYGHDAKFLEMLTDEAKIVSQLAHPNVVQILDVGCIGDDYYIAFEYVEGVDLFRLLQRHHELGKDMPVGHACYVVAELCSALDYAHARRSPDGTALHIVHRDVSPQNVLLSVLGEVKLTDFGIAKAAYRYTQTQAGMVKGKIYYMSPEQALGQPIDHRSDLFSAGILLYEALCTRPLYDEIDQEALFEKVSQASYAWPDDKLQRMPLALRDLVAKALDPRPERRFQSGRELRDTLVTLQRDYDLRVDREQFGSYLREMYQLADDRPPLVMLEAPRPQPGDAGDGWRSRVGPVPQPTVVVGTNDVDEPPRRPAVRVPLPGSVAQAGKPTAVPAPAARPAPAPISATAPRPASPFEDSTDEGHGAASPATAPAALPVTNPRAVTSPQCLQPRRPASPPAAAGSQPLPLPQAGSRPSAAMRPPAVAVRTPLSPAQLPRPPVAGAKTPLPASRPSAPIEVPRKPAGNDASEESTSLLELSDLADRLAEAQASRNDDEPPPVPQSVPPQGPTPPPPVPGNRPSALPVSEASTRFVTAMPDDGDADQQFEDTTKPSRVRKDEAPVPPQVQPPVPMPLLAPMPAPPPPAFAIDEDELPATWGLIALAGLVWVGVLVLSVYATLLTVTR
jgi:serine/threonine protein kinase